MFNSRNPVYRCPTGAVPNGIPVHFKITLPRDLHCSAARLIVRSDQTGGEQTLGMFWCGMIGGNYDCCGCDYSEGEPWLY